MSLYIWLPTFPDAMASLLISIGKRYKEPSHIVCPHPTNDQVLEHYMYTWSKSNYQFHVAKTIAEYELFAREVFSKDSEAIHIFGGFWGYPGRALSLYSSQFCGEHAYIFTEKPSVSPRQHCYWINKAIRIQYSKWKYKKAYNIVHSSIKAIFVTGEKGVKEFKYFGFPRSVLYEAMYTHNDGEMDPRCNNIKPNKPIRFIYLGRFEYLNRGLDLLISAFTNLKLDGWHLDLVGGYGKDSKEVIEWSKSTANVTYIGSWKSDEVVARLSEYDVCISPTRIDGWRIQVNQAIVAGIGTITTTEAISDELINLSDTGIVIPPNNERKLLKAIEYVISHPEVITKWKSNAAHYKDCISNDTVAEYMCEVIDYCESKRKEKPKCPWKP